MSTSMTIERARTGPLGLALAGFDWQCLPEKIRGRHTELDFCEGLIHSITGTFHGLSST